MIRTMTIWKIKMHRNGRAIARDDTYLVSI